MTCPPCWMTCQLLLKEQPHEHHHRPPPSRPAPTPSTRPTAASASSPATPWSPRSAARSTSSRAPATSTPRTRPLAPAADDPGGQHRHPQRRPRRPPAQRTTSSTWRPTRRSRSPPPPSSRSTTTNYRVTGDLTIKGVTKPVTIDFEYTGTAVDPYGNTRIGFEGKTTVNRKDWGVNWNAALEAGGVLVSEKVTLEFEVSAIRTSAS